jgi:glucosamine--fructose-6-phosphate aminotransferase (isomerizing)
MAAEMAEQPDVLARVTARAPADAEAVRALVPRPLAGVVFLARGSSDNAAVFGRYLAELRAGRPAGLAAPSLYTRYHATVDWCGYLVVALSQSGATPEIISTCRAMRAGGAVVLGITNEPDSPLADAVDLLLSTDAGPERAVPATKTVTAQLALLVTVTSALRASAAPLDAAGTPGAAAGTPSAAAGTPDAAAETPGAAGTPRAPGTPGAADGTPGAAGGAPGAAAAPGGGTLDGLPGAVAGVLGDPRPVERLADRWRGLDRLVVAGRGLAYAAALETALKVKETTGILAEGISTADLLHGPIAAVYAGAPVLLVDGGGPADTDLDELRALLASRRAHAASLPVPPGLPEAVHVIAAITRGQQLAYELARARNVNPDAPAHLSKVTATT